MKRAGELDIRIAIQRKMTSYSSTGEPTESWSTLVERWASRKALSGTEVNASEQWVAREQTEFEVRWSPDIADASPLDRVVCPADDASASPEVERSIYDVIAVYEVGRHDAVRIIGARRVG